MLTEQPILPKPNKLHKIKLLASALAVFSLLAGCSNQATHNQANKITLSKDKHIILKKGTVYEQESFQGNDLWERMRTGFQLQNQYASLRNARIEQQQLLLTKNTKATEELLARGNPYLHYIIEQLEQRNMPLELALLPAIESAYIPTAVSNKSAAGLWQFMPKTGVHFNLQQNRWYDARLDVVASTDAALNYLQYLHNMFNDWPLALAAYNSGEGTVKRAIAQNQKLNLPTDYWHLPLPEQTKNYVPKLFALSNVVLTPNNYQVNLKSIANEPYFEKVQVNQQVKLSTIAAVLGVDNEEIAQLNSAFKAQTIIKDQSPKQLLVPKQKASQLISLIASGNIPNENISTWNNYNIRQGDTLSAIAYNHKITVNELKSINNLSQNQILKPGQTLKVPMVASIDNTANNVTPKTTITKTNKKYTIKAGDNLWMISQKNNIKLEKLLKLNQLTANSSIKPGQQLYLSDRN